MSSNENMEIEKLFSERFKDFQPDFSADFKAKIQLEAEKKAKSIRKQRLYKWLFPSAGIGAVAIAAALWYVQDTNLIVETNNNNPGQNDNIAVVQDIDENLDSWETPVVELESQKFHDEFVANTETELDSEPEDMDAETEPVNPPNQDPASNPKPDQSNPLDPVATGNNPDDLPMASDDGEKDDDTNETNPTSEDIKIQDQRKISSVASVAPKTNNIYPSFPNTERGLARYEAYKLRNGALLVRLKTYAQTISALEDHGYTASARKKREEVETENMALYKAFKENFSFSNVYFFYATDSDSIRNGVRKGIFLNEKLERDPNIELRTDYFMIADIGRAMETQRSTQDGEFRNDDILSRVIVLSDSDFNQMEPPFPYYKKALFPSRDGKNVKLYSSELWDFMRGL